MDRAEFEASLRQEGYEVRDGEIEPHRHRERRPVLLRRGEHDHFLRVEEALDAPRGPQTAQERRLTPGEAEVAGRTSQRGYFFFSSHSTSILPSGSRAMMALERLPPGLERLHQYLQLVTSPPVGAVARMR